MKIRIKFRKYGVMRFVGHLDIMRYFQKAMRRAKIDMCYSEGFSPHQIMSFAAPLGVGITSDGEYMDIEVHTTTSSADAMRALNENMVEGMEITGYRLLPEHAKTAMSIVAAASYVLSFKDGYLPPASRSAFERGLEEHFRSQEQVLVTKETKKGEREIDLKQLVYEIKLEGTEEQPCFSLLVSTGSQDNLKPELVLQTLFSRMGLPYEESAIQIHRIDLFTRTEENTLLSLGEMGEPV
jgi:radical SAM-linked protein